MLSSNNLRATKHVTTQKRMNNNIISIY